MGIHTGVPPSLSSIPRRSSIVEPRFWMHAGIANGVFALCRSACLLLLCHLASWRDFFAEPVDDLLCRGLTPRLSPLLVAHLAMHLRHADSPSVRPRGKKPGGADLVRGVADAAATPARPRNRTPASPPP